MATLDASPSLFAGQPWTIWEDQISIGGEDKDESKKPNCNNDTETMKLRKEDKSLFGLCPAQDECYLVVCEHCGQVLKPQALQMHIEERHGIVTPPVSASSLMPSLSRSNTKSPSLSSNSSTPSSRSTPRSTNTPSPRGSKPPLSHSNSTSSRIKNHTNQQHAVSKIKQMPVVKVEPLTIETVKAVIASEKDTPSPKTVQNDKAIKPELTSTSSPGSVSTTTSTVTTAVSTVTTCTTMTNSHNKNSLSASSSSSSLSGKHTKIAKASRFVPCKDRKFDPDRHCGVRGPEDEKPCTRSLTCKTHALSLRRLVKGRRKPFDDLLKEHREAKEKLLQAKAAQEVKPASIPMKLTKQAETSGQPSVTQVKPRLQEKTPVQTKLVSTRHTLNRMARPPPLSLPVREELPPKPEMFRRMSSEDFDDAFEGSDKIDMPYITHHPQPQAFNTFGARLYASESSRNRTYGAGCYVFSRRPDLLRAAFQGCIDRHLHPPKMEPPHKKRCIESRLPRETQLHSPTRDPYEFNSLDNTNNGKQSHALNANSGADTGGGVKSKSKSTSKVIKARDSNAFMAASPVLNSTSANNSGGKVQNTNSNNLKRRRSNTGNNNTNNNNSTVTAQGVLNSSGGFQQITGGILLNNAAGGGLPLAAFPAGISLNLTNAALGSLTMGQPTNRINSQLLKNNINLKDLNIVVTGIDGSFPNGHLVSIPADQALNNGTLNLTDGGNGSAKFNPPAGSRKAQPIQGVVNSIANSGVAGTAVLIDANNPLNAVLTSSSLGHSMQGNNSVITTGVSVTSPPQSSPSTTPSPHLRAGSVSPPAASPLPNGILPSPSGSKHFPGSNHLTANLGSSSISRNSTPSPSPATDTICASQGQKKGSSIGSHQFRQSMNYPRSMQRSQKHSTTQNKILTNSYQPVFTGHSGTPSAAMGQIHLQQSKQGKLAMQPVSLTIPVPLVAPSSGSQAQQARGLFLSTDEHHKQSLQQQMQNSPSNVMS